MKPSENKKRKLYPTALELDKKRRKNNHTTVQKAHAQHTEHSQSHQNTPTNKKNKKKKKEKRKRESEKEERKGQRDGQAYAKLRITRITKAAEQDSDKLANPGARRFIKCSRFYASRHKTSLQPDAACHATSQAQILTNTKKIPVTKHKRDATKPTVKLVN